MVFVYLIITSSPHFTVFSIFLYIQIRGFLFNLLYVWTCILYIVVYIYCLFTQNMIFHSFTNVFGKHKAVKPKSCFYIQKEMRFGWKVRGDETGGIWTVRVRNIYIEPMCYLQIVMLCVIFVCSKRWFCKFWDKWFCFYYDGIFFSILLLSDGLEKKIFSLLRRNTYISLLYYNLCRASWHCFDKT